MWKLNNILLSNYGSKKKVKREKLSWSKWKWKATYQIPCCCLVVQLCLTPCDPLGCSPPGYSVHGILQTRILEWVAISFFRGSSPLRDQNWGTCIAGRFFTDWATGGSLWDPAKTTVRGKFIAIKTYIKKWDT